MRRSADSGIDGNTVEVDEDVEWVAQKGMRFEDMTEVLNESCKMQDLCNEFVVAA